MPLFYTESGFQKALARGELQTVEKYVLRDKQKWMGYRQQYDGSSPLHIAAKEGHTEIVEFLLGQGANIDEKNLLDLTPLALSIINHNYSTMQTLIGKGADITIGTNDGTLLERAIQEYFNDGVELLLDNKADVKQGDPLTRALEFQNPDAIGLLEKAGIADGDKKKAQMLLEYFLRQNMTASAASMIAKGADVNGTDENGELFLNRAVYHGYIDAVKMLVEKGADVNRAGRDGVTPLQMAVIYGRDEEFDFLMSKGARTDIKNKRGDTAIETIKNRGTSHMTKLVKKEEEKKHVRETSPLNATATRLPSDNAETWVRTGDNEVARVSVSPVLGRRLTHIFNFQSRERLIISENLKTGAENVTPPEKFDTLEEAMVQAALAKFRELGGKADDDAVFGGKHLDKKPMPGLDRKGL